MFPVVEKGKLCLNIWLLKYIQVEISLFWLHYIYLSLFICSWTHCHSFIGPFLLMYWSSPMLHQSQDLAMHVRVFDVGAREGGRVFGGQNSLPAHPYLIATIASDPSLQMVVIWYCLYQDIFVDFGVHIYETLYTVFNILSILDYLIICSW